jgi:hypothetical protein
MLTAATRLVPYNHAAHHAQIAFICKDVYGGSDYLPDNLLQYSRDDQKVVRVLEAAEGQDVLGIGKLCQASANKNKTAACNALCSWTSQVDA